MWLIILLYMHCMLVMSDIAAPSYVQSLIHPILFLSIRIMHVCSFMHETEVTNNNSYSVVAYFRYEIIHTLAFLLCVALSDSRT